MRIYRVTLCHIDCGNEKINFIKGLRAALGLGLGHSKAISETWNGSVTLRVTAEQLGNLYALSRDDGSYRFDVSSITEETQRPDVSFDCTLPSTPPM